MTQVKPAAVPKTTPDTEETPSKSATFTEASLTENQESKADETSENVCLSRLQQMPNKEAFDYCLMEDHALIRALFRAYKQIHVKHEEEKQRVSKDIIRRLSTHVVAEELVIYPMYAKHLVLGEEASRIARDEHKMMKKELFLLDHSKVYDTVFDGLMEELNNDFEDHAQHEELNEFPALRKAISEEEATRLGKVFMDAKDMAPTRPHPSAPDSGGVIQSIGNTAQQMRDINIRTAGIAIKPIDIIRDALNL